MRSPVYWREIGERVLKLLKVKVFIGYKSDNIWQNMFRSLTGLDLDLDL